MPSAAQFMRARSKAENWPPAKPAAGHMPFPGSRNVAEIESRREACRAAAFETSARKAMEYGYDPTR